jgi:xylono-1,5-lactonase
MKLTAFVRWRSECALGEGITWHAGSAAWPEAGFFFVDIHGRRLCFTSLSGAMRQQWDVPERIGWWLPAKTGDYWLAGFQSGVARVRLLPQLQVIDWVDRLFFNQPTMRLNDAKADASGRVWMGSLNNDDESRADGGLFMLTHGKRAFCVDTGYLVANGPAFNPDGTTLLHTDSGRRIIYAFDFDVNSGVVTKKRVWLALGSQDGYPDGMTFDAEGCLWLAHWGTGQVTRHDQTGKVISRFQLPTTHVTNICFGGDQLDRLWVTTARAGLSAAQLANQPDAGSVFEILGHGLVGLPAYAASL